MKILDSKGVPKTRVKKLNEDRPNIADLIKMKEVQLIINTPRGRSGISDDSGVFSIQWGRSDNRRLNTEDLPPLGILY